MTQDCDCGTCEAIREETGPLPSKKQGRKARIRELEQQLAEAARATESARKRGDDAVAARADLLDALADAGFVHTSTTLPRDRERMLAHGLAPLALVAPSSLVIERTDYRFGIGLRAEFRLTEAEGQTAFDWIQRR